MEASVGRNGFLLLLAVIFTAGLTFATVELPYLLDGFLQRTVAAPSLDSHVDDVSRLKTELFMAHYHVRALGYIAFFLLLGLIVAGFATKRTSLAAMGALGVMLPVFAQFASVMFFLAGLGMLNAIWLPVLDISYELQGWGRVIDLPNDLLRGMLGWVGVDSPWPTILFFIGAGILFFLLGVYAWLIARAGGEGVARSWVYRISRHPQYLGWILWTYGAYLLVGLSRYPKRSWGIGSSLPWLISTLVILSVAMVEELNMRKCHGEAYEAYHRSAPFIAPLPRWFTKALGWPFRVLFGKERPERIREIVSVVAVYGAVLIGISAFLYGGGTNSLVARFSSPERQAERIQAMVTSAAAATDLHARRYHLLNEVAFFGNPAVEPLTRLLGTPDVALRRLAVGALERTGSQQAVPALEAALRDPDEKIRHQATLALAALGAPGAHEALLARLEDPEGGIRLDVFAALAGLGSPEVLERAPELLTAESFWTRSRALEALGVLGSEAGVPLAVDALTDEEPWVRQEAVITLLRIGSPAARPALEDMVDDPDYEVRIYAAEALDRLKV